MVLTDCLGFLFNPLLESARQLPVRSRPRRGHNDGEAHIAPRYLDPRSQDRRFPPLRPAALSATRAYPISRCAYRMRVANTPIGVLTLRGSGDRIGVTTGS